MPDGEVCEPLTLILQHLSRRFEAPEFPPHVTVLGSCLGEREEMVRQSALVAATLRPFTIHLGEIDFRDQYFRSLFAHAGPMEPLRDAHQAACRTFSRTSDAEFMPHLSLLYGNFPESVKTDIMADLGPQLDVEFEVSSLYLFRTEGPVSDWRRVENYELL